MRQLIIDQVKCIKTRDADGRDECRVEVFGDKKRRSRRIRFLTAGETWSQVANIPFADGALFKLFDHDSRELLAQIGFGTDIKRIVRKKVTTGRAVYQLGFRVTDDPPVKGKGVFVRRTLGSQPGERMKEAGIRWAALQVAFQSSKKPGDGVSRGLERLKKDTKELRKHGIEIWLWGFPIPDKAERFAAVMIPAIRTVRPSGVILNMELAEAGSSPRQPAWNTNKVGTAELKADLLIRFLRKSFPELPLALSSHGFADRNLPWKALKTLDGGMPQAYDSDRSNRKRNGRTFVQQCVDRYRAHYEWVIPTLGANSTKSTNMRLLYKDLGGEVAACAWWSWETLTKERPGGKSTLTARGRVVKSISDI